MNQGLEIPFRIPFFRLFFSGRGRQLRARSSTISEPIRDKAAAHYIIIQFAIILRLHHLAGVIGE